MKYFTRLEKKELEYFGFAKHGNHKDYNVYGINYKMNPENQYSRRPFVGLKTTTENTHIYFWKIDEYALEDKINPFQQKCIGQLKLSMPELLELIDLLKSYDLSNNNKEEIKIDTYFDKVTSDAELERLSFNLGMLEAYVIRPDFYLQTRKENNMASLLSTCCESGIDLTLNYFSETDLVNEKFDIDFHTIGKIVLEHDELTAFINVLEIFYDKVTKLFKQGRYKEV